MTSSDPTREPESGVEPTTPVDAGPESSPQDATDAPSTEVVPRADAGEVADPRDSERQRAPKKPDDRRSPRPEVGRQTRIGAAWIAVAVGVIVLVLLLIFILQNLDPVTVKYFSAHGTMPLGVLLLFAAAGGALLVIVLGFARMLQMRLLARRDRKSRH